MSGARRVYDWNRHAFLIRVMSPVDEERLKADGLKVVLHQTSSTLDAVQVVNTNCTIALGSVTRSANRSKRRNRQF
jgi:hypothetical protein